MPENTPNAESANLATRYDILLQNLIYYRDVSSVALLKSLMIPPQNRRTAWVILSTVLELTDATHRVQDPFVMAFRGIAGTFMSDTWGDDRQNLREPALLLSVRALENPAGQIPLLLAGLHDRSSYVQLAPAREAASLSLTSLSPEVLNSYRRADSSLRPYFCSALTVLNAKCP